MKKLIVFVTGLALGITLSFAQQAPASGAQAPAKKAKTENAGDKSAADEGKKLKKDGTPDKRFKENKETPPVEPIGPKKKDGTPDKRFKENKIPASPKN